nr:hypothetical protein CFP56_24837 [Quercus suber]
MSGTYQSHVRKAYAVRRRALLYPRMRAEKKVEVEVENVVVPPVLLVDDFLPTVVQGQSEATAHFQGAVNEVSEVSEGEAMIHDGAVLESHDSRESFDERLAEIDRDLTRFDKERDASLETSKEGNLDGNKVESTARGAEVPYTAVESSKTKAKVGVEMVTTQTSEKERVLKAEKKVEVEVENVVVPPVLLVDDFLPTVVQGQSEATAHFQGAVNEVSEVSEGEAMIHDGAVLESHDSRESFDERLAEIDRDLTRFDKERDASLETSKEGNLDGNKVESTARGAEVPYTAVESSKTKAKVGVEMVTTQTSEKERVLVSVPIT